MKVDLQSYEIWENLNEAVASELNLSVGTTVRCYPGLQAATFELTQGVAQFYSHKKSIAIIPGSSSCYESMLPFFYRESYSIQTAPENLNAKDWVESLKKDTCFVLLSEDHAVTGELYDHSELEKILNEKRIFCLKISHHNHLFRKEETLPYSIRICSYSPMTAVAQIGSKLKAPPMMVSIMGWMPEQFLSDFKSVRSKQIENRRAVENFESQLPKGFSALLQTQKRCFDRALIYSTEVAGEALQQFLANSLKIQIEKPGWETRLETTNLCRWGGTRNYESWWSPRPSESILRGLLILGTEILEHPEMRASLEKALQECQIAELS